MKNKEPNFNATQFKIQEHKRSKILKYLLLNKQPFLEPLKLSINYYKIFHQQIAMAAICSSIYQLNAKGDSSP